MALLDSGEIIGNKGKVPYQTRTRDVMDDHQGAQYSEMFLS